MEIGSVPEGEGEGLGEVFALEGVGDGWVEVDGGGLGLLTGEETHDAFDAVSRECGLERLQRVTRHTSCNHHHCTTYDSWRVTNHLQIPSSGTHTMLPRCL